MKPAFLVAVCVSGFVTTTFELPASLLGVTVVSSVELTKTTEVASVVPNLTVAPDTKLVPVMVTVVPPKVVPLVGETELIVGAGGRVT